MKLASVWLEIDFTNLFHNPTKSVQAGLCLGGGSVAFEEAVVLRPSAFAEEPVAAERGLSCWKLQGEGG